MNLAQTVVDKLIETDDDLRRLTRAALPGIGISERIRKQFEDAFGKVEVLYYGAATEAERYRWGGHVVRRIVIKIAVLEKLVNYARHAFDLKRRDWIDRDVLHVRIRHVIQRDIKSILESLGYHPTLVHLTELEGPEDTNSDSGWTVTMDIMFTDTWY